MRVLWTQKGMQVWTEKVIARACDGGRSLFEFIDST